MDVLFPRVLPLREKERVQKEEMNEKKGGETPKGVTLPPPTG